MVPAAGQLALLALGFMLAVCQALENSTYPLSGLYCSFTCGTSVLSKESQPCSQACCPEATLPGHETSRLATRLPVAAAVVSHFNDCPDSHTQFCFHGTCRFLVQEEKPACVCHSGYVGVRCEHADLLAVVAASQKKQAITALVVVSIVALAVLIVTCVLIHCCHIRKHCEWCRALVCRHEKPSALLKGKTACCHSETVV